MAAAGTLVAAECELCGYECQARRNLLCRPQPRGGQRAGGRAPSADRAERHGQPAQPHRHRSGDHLPDGGRRSCPRTSDSRRRAAVCPRTRLSCSSRSGRWIKAPAREDGARGQRGDGAGGRRHCGELWPVRTADDIAALRRGYIIPLRRAGDEMRQEPPRVGAAAPAGVCAGDGRWN